MERKYLIAISLFFVIATPLPALAQPPGHRSNTVEVQSFTYFDFKDGIGIADPSDQNSPCTTLFLGQRVGIPGETWEADQNMGTNLNGFGVGISNLVPPLTPAGGWLPNSGGINLGIPCPIPGSGTGSLWLIWSGVNWRSAEADSSSEIFLCTQEVFSGTSPGCLAIPNANMRLITAACNWNDANFGANYADGKGKYFGGFPYDSLAFKSDQMKCNPKPHSATNQANNAWKKVVDWTDTIQSFFPGSAAQTFDIIKNENAVPNGFGPAYMAVCWRIDYLDFQDPLNPVQGTAQTHDWKLIIDLGFGGKKGGGPAEFIAALQAHYGGAQIGDQYTPTSATALRGFYSQDSGNPKSPGAGENGFPCPTSGQPHQVKAKKPAPLI